MGETTGIDWTDHTFNPWWGCTRVSPACNNCYAETFAKRLGKDLWGKNAERRFFGAKHWQEPVIWNAKAEAAGKPKFVFCASMADVFEVGPDGLSAERSRLYELIWETPWLTWLLLTKRPENARLLLPWAPESEPWPNVWVGTTVEDQKRADERIPLLLDTTASRRFLSMEPLLGPVDLIPEAFGGYPESDQWTRDREVGRVPLIDWVITGGESGAGHRPPDPEWFRSVRDQCSAAGVPLWFKQWGGRTAKAGGKELDGVEWCERPSPSTPVLRTGTSR